MPYIDDDTQDGLEAEVDGLKGVYNDPDKSEWKVTVVDGANLLAPFQIQPQ